MVRATLRPSRLLAAAFAAVHISAAATLMPLNLSLGLKLACAVLIAASLIQSVRRYALLRGRKAIKAIEVRDQQTGVLRSSNDTWHAATILGTTYVTPCLTVVNLRRAGARLATTHVLLTLDSIDADDFREIRVLLRWARPRAAPDPDGPLRGQQPERETSARATS